MSKAKPQLDREIDVTAEQSIKALEDYRELLMDHHEQWNEVRKAQGGRSTDTQADEAMKDTLAKVREVDKMLYTLENQ